VTSPAAKCVVRRQAIEEELERTSLVSTRVAVAVWRECDTTGDTVAPRASDGALSSTRWTTFIRTPAPAWEVKLAMGVLRHGKVPPPVSHSREGVRFAAAATLRK